MNRQPLVSIIIPTYNYGKHLSDIIESVLAQTYSNIEVIVVDDGSTDDTREIVKHFPVKYFYQENQGTSHAMNTGIRLSKGDFYICSGADDKLHPRYVEICLREIIKDPKVAFVWTAAQEFGASSDLRIPQPLATRYSILRGPGGQLGAALFRRKAYEEVGGYDETLNGLEDWDLAIRLCMRGWKAKAIRQPIYFIRVHPMQKTSMVRRSQYTSVLMYRYPLMHLLMPLSRSLRWLQLCLTKPREAIKRLNNKVQSKLVGYQIPHLDHDYEKFFKVEEGDTVVDAGAYIGLFTLSIAKKAKRVVAIEPELKNFNTLLDNMRRRRLHNVLPIKRALWNSKGTLPLHLGRESASHSLINDLQILDVPHLTDREVAVDVDTLDSILKGISVQEVDFVKIDVEGSEIEALEGAEETLRKASKIVVACYHQRAGEKTKPVITQILSMYGFELRVTPDDIVYGWKTDVQRQS